MRPQPRRLLDPAPVDIVPREVEIGGLPNVPHRIVIVAVPVEELVLVLDIAVHPSRPGNLYIQVFRRAELGSAPRTHGDIGFRGRTSMIVEEVVVDLEGHAIEPGQLFGQDGHVALRPP